MKSFFIEIKDLPYTEMAYSEWFDYSCVDYPEKIEITLNVDKLEMGINDGSALGVMFERTINGVTIGDCAFATINLDDNSEINPWLQTIVLEEGELDENDRKVLLGNKGRFRFFLSQANPNGTPSKASFRAAILVK